MAAPTIDVSETEAIVVSKLADIVIDNANTAIEKRGMFAIGVSGGSAAKFLCSGLPSRTTDWKKWRIFFCDERYVPYDDAECTYSVYKKGLVSQVPDLADNIFPINPDIPVDQAADDYMQKVRAVFPGGDIPRFDVLVLGMGPDGHTCSLFPGHSLLQENTKLITSITDSPKPPPSRVTFTFPLVNNAACAVFASCGAGKADIVQRVLEGEENPPLPAAMVQPTNGEVIWLLDEAAAGKLGQKQKL